VRAAVAELARFKAMLNTFKAMPTPFFKSSILSTFDKAEATRLIVYVTYAA